MKSIKTQYGYEIVLASTDNYFGRSIIIMEGEQTPMLYHKKQDKTIFVLQGIIQLDIEGKKNLMKEGESYHIPPRLIYKIVALNGDATIVEIGTKFENDEVIVKE